ncbi:hemolymph juvenile hormone binding protein (JHBP) [Popillia japonica]|uniref:Hemolymph juvenile hormone binding protein (JHBP) n=1 Tax=Popillia japonica TaxID=7064 RepID=A0AAW1N775_POPJA
MSLLLIILVCINVVLSEKLPEFIESCAQNDTNIDECFVNNAMKAIPELIKGIDYLKVPVLSPLFIQQIQLVHTDNII